MINPAHVGTPDPAMLRRLAGLLEFQTSVFDSECKAIEQLDELNDLVQSSAYNLDTLVMKHQAIMLELEQAGLELSELLLEEERTQTVTTDIVIDNVIINIEIQFETLTKNGNSLRSINGITIKRGNERVDIVSQNSKTLIVYADKELVMDVAIRTICGSTPEDTLRLVMTAIERWTLEHRHDNHYDLVINLLLKCKVIVHPEEKDITPPPEHIQVSVNITTRAQHSRTYIPHGTTFWRDGHYRTSCYGVRYWVEGHWVTR